MKERLKKPSVSLIMKSKSILALVLCFAFLFHACDKEEAIPAFLYIENVTLETGIGQGSASADFRTVRVFSGVADIGQFYLPATIPVLAEGDTELDIFFGINDNGISTAPTPYDLLKRHDLNLNLVPGETDTLEFVTNYKDDVEFVFADGFESQNHVLKEDLDGDLATEVELTTTDVFEGSGAALFVVSDEHPELEVGTPWNMELPPRVSPVYIELNYKSEVFIEVGVGWITTGGTEQTLIQNVINPKDEWGKIYLNVSEQLEALNTLNTVQAWRAVIRVRMPVEDGQVVQGERNAIIDNLKLIHYKF